MLRRMLLLVRLLPPLLRQPRTLSLAWGILTILAARLPRHLLLPLQRTLLLCMYVSILACLLVLQQRSSLRDGYGEITLAKVVLIHLLASYEATAVATATASTYLAAEYLVLTI